jgi:hypothetical protein
VEAGYWTGALGLGLQPSRKTICSGGVVSCRVCPRRATRVFREVAWPAVTVNSRSFWTARNAGKPAS